MRTRSFLFGALPVLCGLFAAALFLPGCDSGADFSSLEAIAPNDGLTAKARAWYAEQVEFEVSDRLSKAEGDEDSLALLSFIEKFPPDWNESVVLSIDGTEETLVLATTLGKYTDERYDSVMYHVRTLVMDMEPSGDVVSGHVIAFSSDEKLSKENFTDYVERYVAKDFAGMKMTVSRYTIIFEDVDSYFYRPNKIPLELRMSIVISPIINKNFATSLSDCHKICSRTRDTLGCAGPLTTGNSNYNVPECPANQIPPGFDIFCNEFCWPGTGTGYDGNRPPTNLPDGGGGDNDDSSEENNDDEDKCECPDQAQCDLADEYTSNDQGSWSCSDFKQISPEWRRGANGYESKHNGLGYISPTLRGNVAEMGYDFRMAFYITSAYRCPNGNAAVGGGSLSQHKYGTAADLNPPASQKSAWTNDFKREIAVNAVRKRGAGYSDYQYESKNHVHVDWGPKRRSPWEN